MSMKVAAEGSCSELWLGKDMEKVVVVVREYDEERDKVAVETMEMQCQVGQKGKASLMTDLLGDPLGRIRHFPLHCMLVAECDEEIVGVIRGCIKTVSRGRSNHAKVGNILGLRVSPTHRKLGIGLKLVQEVEEWCRHNGAEYAYMATDSTNEPSINLFIGKCRYKKFCTASMLVQPVYAHQWAVNSDAIVIIQLAPRIAESIYMQVFADSEFFPKDIDSILTNKLNLGTFMALPKRSLSMWHPKTNTLPLSYAILSIWNTKEVFKFRLKGVSGFKKACCLGSRKVDLWLPWLKIPSFPNMFRQFGVYFLYGLHMEGKNGSTLMKSLCAFAHNMAKDDVACGALVAEVGSCDSVKAAIPHWRRFSWSDDYWCIKKLAKDDVKLEQGSSPEAGWFNRPPSPVLFVDPRDV